MPIPTAEIITERDIPANIDTMPRADTPAIWADFRAKLTALKTTAETLTVTSVEQKREMKLARETRLALKELRVSIEKKRKELGDEYLKQTQKINGAARELRDLIEPLELRLEEQEKFAEVTEEKRKADLKAKREDELSDYVVNVSIYKLDEMTEPEYQQILASSRHAFEERRAAQKKADEERIAREKEEAAERERLRLENERLKQEAQEREAQAKREREEAARIAEVERKRVESQRKAADEKARQAAEEARKQREAAETEARKEREAREKLEQEKREREEEEARKLKAEADAAKKAARAPEKVRLIAFAKIVRELAPPVVRSEEAQRIYQQLSERIAGLAAWIETAVVAL